MQSDQTSVLELWLRKNSESRLKLEAKVYLGSHRGRRSEPWKKWVQEMRSKAKEGHLELRERKAERCAWGEGRGKGPGVLQRQKELIGLST